MAQVTRLQHASIPIPVNGNDQARAFFRDVLGMTEILPPVTLPREALVWFAAGEGGHEIHCFVDASGITAVAAQHFCLQVDDLEGFRQHVAEHGIAIEETIAIHNRPRFFLRDPFGNQIEIAQIIGHYDE